MVVDPVSKDSDGDSDYSDLGLYVTPDQERAEANGAITEPNTATSVKDAQEHIDPPRRESLEAKVEALFSLLETFRSTFKSQLQSLQEDVNRLAATSDSAGAFGACVQRLERDGGAAWDAGVGDLQGLRRGLERLGAGDQAAAAEEENLNRGSGGALDNDSDDDSDDDGVGLELHD